MGRLYDFFIAGPPLMPVYLAAAIVLHREQEILDTECEMSAVHGLLSTIPVDLPFERLLIECHSLYEKERERVKSLNSRGRLKKSDAARRSSHDPSSYSGVLTKIVIITAPVLLGVLVWRLVQ